MHLLEHATSWVIGVISHLGYAGLYAGMFAQAVGIPLSSEVQLAFAGYLASTHVLAIVPVMIAGAAGDISGAIFAYFIG
jgi:membrane protein DedA with SNARE-associated domain